MKITKKELSFVILFLFFIAWTVLIYHISPEGIIENLGIKNSYLIVFLTCLFGGISIFFPFPYYLIVFTLGAGGLNPFLIGLFAGIGLAVGDTTSYLLGHTGRIILPKSSKRISEKIHKKIALYPEWLKYFLFFIWGALVPLPNDLLLIPMGAIGYSYKKVVIPLVLGSIVFNTIIAFLGAYGLNLIFFN